MLYHNILYYISYYILLYHIITFTILLYIVFLYCATEQETTRPREALADDAVELAMLPGLEKGDHTKTAARTGVAAKDFTLDYPKMDLYYITGLR